MSGNDVVERHADAVRAEIPPPPPGLDEGVLRAVDAASRAGRSCPPAAGCGGQTRPRSL